MLVMREVQTRDAEVAEAAHLCLMRFNARATAARPGGEIDDRGDELLYCDPHPFPFLSGAMRSHRRDDGDALISRAERWFGERGRAYTVLAREGVADRALERAAEAAGMRIALDRYPEMVCQGRLKAPPVEGMELRRVEDAGGARAFWRVCAESYPSLGFPIDAFEGFPVSVLLGDDSAAFLGRLEGRIVASAMSTVIEGGGFVGWVGTTDAARGRGVGAAVTVAATNAAFDLGARFVSLQASPMGESIYARLGYRELFNYRIWAKPLGPQSESASSSR
jgi:hypothetical protein